jgi:hypothetical protein
MKKFRSLAEVLAKWQGGIRLKPGQSYIIENVPEEAIKKAWGSVPSAIAFEGSTFVFEEMRRVFIEYVSIELSKD